MALVDHLGARCPAHTWVIPPIMRLQIPPPPDFEVENPPAPPAPPAPVRRRQPPADHLRCTGIKQNGQRCNFGRKVGERCRTHAVQADAPPAPAQIVCAGRMGTGEPCGKRSITDGLCGVHFRSRDLLRRKISAAEWHMYDDAAIDALLMPQAAEKRAVSREYRRLLNRPTEAERAGANYRHTIDDHRLRIVGLTEFMKTRKAGILKQLKLAPVEDVPEEALCAPRARIRVDLALQNYLEGRDVAQRRAEVVLARRDLLRARLERQRENPLGRFANDRQNVHTTETNTMLREVETRLVDATPAEHTIHEISWCWYELSVGTPQMRNTVRADMEHWYKTSFVRELDDYAYKKMLDRIWGLIKSSRHREDMEKRLWEEALDSVGMCADGHLTRLANAVQGFDESEAPVLEVPKSERLQTAMAQISELDPSERESAARRIFAELGVAEDAQRPWLEALEV